MKKNKKAVTGQIVSIFIMVLIIAILAGLTFLFVVNFKTNIEEDSRISGAVTNETVTNLSETESFVAMYDQPLFEMDISDNNTFVVTNSSDGVFIHPDNYSITREGGITSYALDPDNSNGIEINVSYKFTSVSPTGAYAATNKTEYAGYNTTTYLSLLFLALIFGAILTVIIRVIIPYLNLGNNVGGF